MGEDYAGGLERRLGISHRAAAAFRNGIEAFVKGVRNGSVQLSSPYVSIVKRPEKPFYAFGDLVKNLVQTPADFYHYARGCCTASFDKKVSRSLAISEAIVLAYGAQKGASLMSHVVDNQYLQASVGGLIGSEITTAAAFFLTYAAFTSVISLKSKKEGGLVSKLVSSLREAGEVCLVTIPAGVLSFASADLGISALAIKLGADSAAAATIGAVGGFVLYSGTAEVAVHNSAENGRLKHD